MLKLISKGELAIPKVRGENCSLVPSGHEWWNVVLVAQSYADLVINLKRDHTLWASPFMTMISDLMLCDIINTMHRIVHTVYCTL